MYQRIKSTLPNNTTTRNVGVFLELSGESDDTSPRQKNALAAQALRELADRIEQLDATKDVVNIDVLGLWYGNMLIVKLPLIGDDGVKAMQKMSLKAWQHQWNVAYGAINDHGNDTHVTVTIDKGQARDALFNLSDYKVHADTAEAVILTNSM